MVETWSKKGRVAEKYFMAAAIIRIANLLFGINQYRRNVRRVTRLSWLKNSEKIRPRFWNATTKNANSRSNRSPQHNPDFTYNIIWRAGVSARQPNQW